MINYKKISLKLLNKLNVQERVQAIKNPGIGRFLMSALTPTEIAELFPRYYLKSLPDISGFLKALPTGTMAAKQAFFQEQLNNTASGEAAGENMEEGGWRRKLQEGVTEQTATPLKPGELPQPKLTPEQKTVVESLQKGENIPASDPKVKFIGTMTPQELKDVGLEKFKGEGDKEFYKYVPPVVTDEEVKKKVAAESKSSNLFFDAIMKAEGTNKYGDPYNTSLGYVKAPKPLTEMTMREVLAWGDQIRHSTDLGRKTNSSAKGAFQITNQTQKDAMIALGIGMDEKFSPENQKRMASWRASVGNGLGAWEGFKSNPEQRKVAEQAMQQGLHKSFVDPITQDYSKEQMDAEREKAIREINAKRMGTIAEKTQAAQPEETRKSSKLADEVAPDMENAYRNTSATKHAHPFEGVVFHVTGKQNIEDQMDFQRKTGYGYHYVIDKDGKVYQMAGHNDRPNQIRPSTNESRTNRLDLNNNNALGVGFITGGGAPTKQQMEAAQRIMPSLYKEHGVPLRLKDGSPNYPFGHGEIQGNDPERNTLGPGGTPEGQAMANMFRNEKYWTQLEKNAGTVNPLAVTVKPSSTDITEKPPTPEELKQRSLGEFIKSMGAKPIQPAPDEKQKTRIEESLKPSPDVPQGVERPAPKGQNVPGQPLPAPAPVPAPEPPKIVPQRYKFNEASFEDAVRGKYGILAAMYDRAGLIEEFKKNLPKGVTYEKGVLTIKDPNSPAIKETIAGLEKEFGKDTVKSVITQIKEEKKKEEPKPEVKAEPRQPETTQQQRIEKSLRPSPDVPQGVERPAPQGQIRPRELKMDTKNSGVSFNTEKVQEPAPSPEVKPVEQKAAPAPAPAPAPEVKPVEQKAAPAPAPAPEVKPVEQTPPTEPVKTNEAGGKNETNTSQISAMPIGGIKSDNSVVVDANQKPLFTMNTEKEAAVYDPTKRNVDVIPKSSTIGKTPSPQSNMQSEMDILRSDIMSLKEGKQNPAQDITKGSKSHITDRDSGMIENIMSMTKHIFLDPSAARAYSRARFVETGDSTNDFHHSGGNSNMKN